MSGQPARSRERTRCRSDHRAADRSPQYRRRRRRPSRRLLRDWPPECHRCHLCGDGIAGPLGVESGTGTPECAHRGTRRRPVCGHRPLLRALLAMAGQPAVLPEGLAAAGTAVIVRLQRRVTPTHRYVRWRHRICLAAAITGTLVMPVIIHVLCHHCSSRREPFSVHTTSPSRGAATVIGCAFSKAHNAHGVAASGPSLST